ncbi:unnamed protein product [Polarella glacialis]|uniref:Cytochrome P450 n=1 Tax=Polarella glacialis TaxID=89957 RepID=A0A813HX45_POLGL|nr:unnamed protein product [Polarella glacialis]CAE8668066.1 unnamed protein product [Polarella glacialis]|eukprot:CAMPEP_0115083214 /NCGR_PEP_ID=MMETSP0227-20121206/20392_1 /TAXON_ID=89957 /ORGANISM="Polarella glacialis, Strain CCMP 1383" /LENGTH=525 /DNA_ID=CAMNT_0002471509 /DNA_START=71 /DNA_END=1648 /DNA_ORIENTATION=+
MSKGDYRLCPMMSPGRAAPSDELVPHSSLPYALCSWAAFNMGCLLVLALWLGLGCLLYFALGENEAALGVFAAGILTLALLLLSFVLVYLCAKNSFQIWALKHPWNPLSRLFIPCISVFEGLEACNPAYLVGLRELHGKNFCCAGQVVLSDFAQIASSLASGQQRQASLGAQPLIASHFLGGAAPGGSRNTFLLALSDDDAPEEDSQHHGPFRKCLVENFLGHGSLSRQTDSTAVALLDTLEQDYAEMGMGESAFFDAPRKGWRGFWIRYSHYVLLGMDPADEAAMDTLQPLFGTDMLPLLHYLMPFGYFTSDTSFKKVAALYESSPALKDFEERCPAWHMMTKKELSELMVAVMRIAAITGTCQLGSTVMGNMPFPAYGGHATREIDVRQIWDYKLDLDDPLAVRRYVLECARLYPPVSAASRVAREDFEAEMSGQLHRFPAGTKVLIGHGLGMVDPEVWGSSSFDFDAERPLLETHTLAFNAVGTEPSQQARRQCPGQELVLETLVIVLQRLGRLRRLRLHRK